MCLRADSISLLDGLTKNFRASQQRFLSYFSSFLSLFQLAWPSHGNFIVFLSFVMFIHFALSVLEKNNKDV